MDQDLNDGRKRMVHLLSFITSVAWLLTAQGSEITPPISIESILWVPSLVEVLSSRSTKLKILKPTQGRQIVVEIAQGPRKGFLEASKYFMAVALLTAKRSRDPNTQVGACIVNKEKKIVGIGYNKMPNDCNNLPWNRDNPKSLNYKHLYVCHAEMNAIMNKNSADLKDSTIYVTLFPCNECSKLIIQSGISEVVYLSDKYSDRLETKASKRMLDKAHILYRSFPLKPMPDPIYIDFNI